jgi:predicted regulator of Ras-like GTPase activity (Roadblock/LC7/MglB family)
MKKFIIDIISSQIKHIDTIGGFLGWAIVEKNGLLVKSKLPRDINDKAFGVMSATIYEGIEAAIQSLDNESIYNITIELNDCQVIVMNLSRDTLIIVILQLDANLGLILIELEEINKKINELIINEQR